MISTADGCSGAGGAPPGYLSVDWTGDWTAPIDAVIVLRADVSLLSDQQALDALTVQVTNPAGSPVAGTLSLEDAGSKGSLGRTLALIWKPNALLEPSSTYGVSWSVAESALSSPTKPVTGQGQLRTLATGAPSVAPTGSATFGRACALSGTFLTCENSNYYSSCHYQISLATSEVEIANVTFAWSYPDTGISPYRLVRLEPRADGGQPKSTLPKFIEATPMFGVPPEIAIEFEDRPEPATYCITLVTRDLRNASEQSIDLCADSTEVSAPTRSLLEQLVSQCKSSPTSDLLALWCRSHPSADECAALDPGSFSSDGGGISCGSISNDSSTKPEANGSSHHTASLADACQCKTPGGSGSRSGAMIALALAAVAALLRRARRRPATSGSRESK